MPSGQDREVTLLLRAWSGGIVARHLECRVQQLAHDGLQPCRKCVEAVSQIVTKCRPVRLVVKDSFQAADDRRAIGIEKIF